MLQALEHAQIPVRDMERAIMWYAEYLGFKPTGRDGDRIAFLSLPAGPILMLWKTTSDTAAHYQVDGVDFPVLLYRTERIHELHGRLSEAGARIQVYEDGGFAWVLKFYDPEGNLWGALQMNEKQEEA
ncbi:VOC family protein [Paenibacillus sacheonensis]|uniref:VOC family protein n=1 Tax=Paenibacillus sacheonensis TaxID=742054 RepID=A0A7X4YTV6_9BACL|nr:VOC family protein [Paenibacillus sacheonensis]MBM7568634.1 catechol 2,3-dioxygenase-like lactoylglutathione lyase family enzyme [Paenibacillus sacheonensis]NBC72473.1 VOC family protein [Paenibacillus sacheonensis]